MVSPADVVVLSTIERTPDGIVFTRVVCIPRGVVVLSVVPNDVLSPSPRVPTPPVDDDENKAEVVVAAVALSGEGPCGFSVLSSSAIMS